MFAATEAEERGEMKNKRRRVKQATSLLGMALQAREKAADLAPGKERDLLLQKARDADRG